MNDAKMMSASIREFTDLLDGNKAAVRAAIRLKEYCMDNTRGWYDVEHDQDLEECMGRCRFLTFDLRTGYGCKLVPDNTGNNRPYMAIKVGPEDLE